jgi:hypothetical protein
MSRKPSPVLPKPLRFMVLYDIHGNEQCPRTVAAFLDHAKDFKPDIRIIGGDLWDFAALRLGASLGDECRPLKPDFDSGADVADKFFKKGAQNHFLVGNHEVRLYNRLSAVKATERALAVKCVEDIDRLFAPYAVNVHPYTVREGVLRLGQLNVAHGFGKGGETALREHCKAFGEILIGHVHTPGEFTMAHFDGPKTARSSACACRLDLQYCDTLMSSLRWQNGWSFGFLYPDGSYTLLRASRVGDSFYAVAAAPKKY